MIETFAVIKYSVFNENACQPELNRGLYRMSLPNRAGILTLIDGVEEGNFITLLVIPVMLNS